jgi:predicted Fe-Mo cluster-binding NifX family protein
MRIAVSVENPNLDAPMDPCFERASYFVVVDSETMAWEALENRQNLALPQGAEIQSAWAVLTGYPEVVLTRNCGSKRTRCLRHGAFGFAWT